jgi:predicted MPP superfamily phosphohydrolase
MRNINLSRRQFLAGLFFSGTGLLSIDYVFSGHSHGGQLNIFGYIPNLPPGVGNYIKGWYKDKSPELYVSKGIGTSILPIRLGARAEIAVFNYSVA